MEEDNQYIVKKGFCKVSNSSSDAIFHEEWPVYKEVCQGGAGSQEQTLPP